MKKGRAKLQAFGGFLTAMVIPNMGAFIAWGFITEFLKAIRLHRIQERSRLLQLPL